MAEELQLRNARSSLATGKSLLVAGQNFNFITQAMRTKFLSSFEKDLDDTNPLYLFYSQSIPWANDNDSPLVPTNAFTHDINARRNMIGAQRITANGTRIAFRKFRWTPDTVYKQYDTAIDQTSSPNNRYYIVQDRPDVVNYGAVYKCLDNAQGRKSLYKPFQFINPQVKPARLEDGYLWKYMFTIPGSYLSQFNTNQSPKPDYVPLVVDTSFKSGLGTIDRIDIDSPGRSYKPTISSNGKYYGVYDTPVVPIFIEGDGDEVSSAEVVVKEVNANTGNSLVSFEGVGDGITNIKYADRQDKYTVLGDTKLNRWVPVKFIEEVGEITSAQAAAISNLSRKISYGLAKIGDNGLINSPGDLKIVFGGSDYTKGTKLRVVQSSTIAYGIEYNSPNQLASVDTKPSGISKVNVVQSGQNFANATTVAIHASPGPSGFVGKAIVSPLRGHGGDPKAELNANAIFINARINAVDQTGAVTQNLDFSSTNDFRQVGLIQGARIPGSNNLCTNKTVRAMHTIQITDTQNQIKNLQDAGVGSYGDITITGSISRARGRIVDIFGDSNIKTIRYIQVGVRGFLQNENVLLPSGNVSNIPINSVTEPEIDVYTGDILYINNNNSISRSAKQTETINFLIKF
jgi:hypothetical protein